MMKPRRGVWVPVVTAFLRKGPLVLLGQRPPGHTLAGQWEFPGGKIEKGESPEVALKRELNEELGIDADIGKIQMASTHSYGDTGIVLLFFEVLYWRGELKPVYHQDIRWVKVPELRQYDVPEANRKILDRIIGILTA